jgi:hypothetical protein
MQPPNIEPEEDRFPEEEPTFGSRESEPAGQAPEEPSAPTWQPEPETVRPEPSPGPSRERGGEAPREIRYGRRPRDARNRPPNEPRPERTESNETTREEMKSPPGETAPWVASHLHTDP